MRRHILIHGAACAASALVALGAVPLAAQSDTPSGETGEAQAAAPAGGFTFKRVAPPGTSARKLIDIQIQPVMAPVRVLGHKPNLPPLPADSPGRRTVVTPSGAGPAASDTALWFWTRMSPKLADGGFARMPIAVQALVDGGRSPASLANPAVVRRIADTWGEEILKATAGTQVSPALVAAVIAVESAGRPKARSHAGAVGLMQLMPATAARFGVTDRTDPAQSIRGGTKYLEFLLNEFGGDALMALAGYNAGEGAVARSGGVPPYAETRAYVPKVVAAWAQARLMCIAPPVRVTDGCLFSGVTIAAR